MVELTYRIFKTTIINVFKDSKESRNIINIEMEGIKNNHIKLVEIKNKISEMKNSPERISIRLDIEEQWLLILKTQG